MKPCETLSLNLTPTKHTFQTYLITLYAFFRDPPQSMSDEEFRFEPGDLVDVQGPGGHYEWAHIEGIMPLHVVVIYLLTGTVGSVPRANLRAPMQLFPSEAEAEAALKASGGEACSRCGADPGDKHSPECEAGCI